MSINCSPAVRPTPIVNITSLSIGDSAEVVSVSGSTDFVNRLADLGLNPGMLIRVVRVAPGGSPYLVKVRDFYLTLRREDARRVEVRCP
ncbi:MAG: ferrous iron transport protein A [Candidatus Neomarinimicrobiota bacterium]|nr:MAG: ferrous iron transport protein A [Candidatus Neomarinimicrobiota bacterium]